MSSATRKATIYAEDATVISQLSFPGNQYVLRVEAPRAARHARPGSFAHITCDESIRLRRPLSIMRADPAESWVEFLYKPVGHGLAKLALKKPGDSLSLLAPIGRGFELNAARPRILAIGGGVGIPPMVFLADRIKADKRFMPIVLMGSEIPFPFELTETQHEVDGAPPEAAYGVALLEKWGIPSRLASQSTLPGCHSGYVTDLAEAILDTLSLTELAQVHICACGPQAMLTATASLAAAYDVECDLALEEYMACGVGGCAGCTVLVKTKDGDAMKRVCVDGPVFKSREIYPT